MAKAQYLMALEGVTRWGLAQAIKAVLQGALGHWFFPSPPELRSQCDKAMGPVWARDKRERQASESHRNTQNVVSDHERLRMGFKLRLLSAAMAVPGGADMLSEANNSGLPALIALGERWSIDVPSELARDAA